MFLTTKHFRSKPSDLQINNTSDHWKSTLTTRHVYYYRLWLGLIIDTCIQGKVGCFNPVLRFPPKITIDILNTPYLSNFPYDGQNSTNSNMTFFKRFESKPVVKIIYTYTHCNLWRHRQFITIFYQFLHIRIEIIHGSHMYILFLPRVDLYVSFLPLVYARGKTSWHKGLLVVKTIYTCTYGFHELFLNSSKSNG